MSFCSSYTCSGLRRCLRPQALQRGPRATCGYGQKAGPAGAGLLHRQRRLHLPHTSARSCWSQGQPSRIPAVLVTSSSSRRVRRRPASPGASTVRDTGAPKSFRLYDVCISTPASPGPALPFKPLRPQSRFTFASHVAALTGATQPFGGDACTRSQFNRFARKYRLDGSVS